MIARILDFLDHAKLARTVILQTRQLDHLDRLVAHLQDALEVAETAAEEYRSRIPPPRDARSREAEVLSVCEAWRADRERDTAARLNRAEVELAVTRAEVESLRRDLTDERDSKFNRTQALMVERERAIRIGHAWQRSARALSRALRTVTRVHGRQTERRINAGTCYRCGQRPIDPAVRITCRPCYDEADAQSRAEVEAERAAIARENRR